MIRDLWREWSKIGAVALLRDLERLRPKKEVRVFWMVVAENNICRVK